MVAAVRPHPLGPLATLATASAVVMAARWGTDWPAQEFRAWTAAHHGLIAWTNAWYGGQPLPGYSVLYPLLAGVLGAGATGLVAVFAASLGATRLAPAAGRAVRVGYELSVVLVLVSDLVVGQVPYLLGVAFGVWAVHFARAGRAAPAAVFALAAALASPLAGSFVLLAGPALAIVLGWRRVAPLIGAAAGVAACAVLGGAGGPFPFPTGCLIAIAAFCVVILALTTDRAARMLAASYLVATLAALAVPNPVGSNIIRFGQLLALPLVWHIVPTLRLPRRVVLVPLVALAALWPALPAIETTSRGAADQSRSAAYYTGLLQFLHGQDPTTGRIEVVMTREHWESLWVAKEFPIARGWERQTDLSANRVLYRTLTPQTYRRWLVDNAVSFVALPDAPIDTGGRAEATLLRDPPAYLRPVWHDRHWQVWRVSDARPLVSGPATMARYGTASFALSFQRPGTAVVRIRSSGMWTITRGDGCVDRTSDGWLTVRVASPTSVTLRARLGLGQLSDDPRCS